MPKTAPQSPNIAANRRRLDDAILTSARNPGGQEYLQLRRIIAANGLLNRQYRYYAVKIAGALAMLATGIAVIALFDPLWVQMLNAVFLAIVFAQFGFIGHDSGHRQIFRSPRNNDLVMLLAGLVTGMAPSWWQDKHNTHHRNPNQLGHDGDIEVSVFAFTEEQALETRGPLRFLVKYQAFFFYPMLLLTSLSLLGGSAAYLARRERAAAPAEPAGEPERAAEHRCREWSGFAHGSSPRSPMCVRLDSCAPIRACSDPRVVRG